MADVGGDAGRAADVVEAERGDVGVELEEEREGLADASSCAEDGDLGLACGGGREAAGLGEGAESCAREHGSDEHESNDDDEERERTKEVVVVVERKPAAANQRHKARQALPRRSRCRLCFSGNARFVARNQGTE